MCNILFGCGCSRHIFLSHIASIDLVNGKVPWRDGREKDFKSIQILIEALRAPSFVVLDAYTSTSWFMTYS
jgi:hypothetical protein